MFEKQNMKQSGETEQLMNVEESEYLKFFKAHLNSFLNGETPPGNETNTPHHVITNAISNIGTLSRIFDAFDFPVPSYDEMLPLLEKPNGLREHIDDNLKVVLPVLLNKDRNALNPEVIAAIMENPDLQNINGYEDFFKNTDQNQIAKKFVEAVIVSYGQKIIDRMKNEGKSRDEQVLANEKLLTPLWSLSNEVTLNGLPACTAMSTALLNSMLDQVYDIVRENLNQDEIIEQDKNTSANAAVRKKAQVLQSIQENARGFYDVKKYDKAMERYNALINKFMILYRIEDKKPSDLMDSDGLERILSNLKELLDDPDVQSLNINGITDNIAITQEFLNLYKKTNAPLFLDKAYNTYSNTIKAICSTATPQEPKKANHFIQFLRWLMSNEKLLQNKDEKSYERQKTIQIRISDVTKEIYQQLKEGIPDEINADNQENKDETLKL